MLLEGNPPAIAGILNGAAFDRNVVNFVQESAAPTNTEQFIAAISIEVFGKVQQFLSRSVEFDVFRMS